MKKIYTSPAIEIENIEVEQGIALSDGVFHLGGENSIFDLTGAEYEDYNNGAAIW